MLKPEDKLYNYYYAYFKSQYHMHMDMVKGASTDEIRRQSLRILHRTEETAEVLFGNEYVRELRSAEGLDPDVKPE